MDGFGGFGGAEGAVWLYTLLAVTTLPPAVPNSALIAAAGALAASGRLSLPLVLLVVAGSAVAGDAVIHLLGRWAGRPLRAWAATGARRRAALGWTAERIRRHGVPFVVAVRFLPAGRITGGAAAGAVGYPVRRFLLGAGIAELLWAGYGVGIGYGGGTVLAGTWPGLLLGVGASVVLAVLASVAGRVIRGAARGGPEDGPGGAEGSGGAGGPGGPGGDGGLGAGLGGDGGGPGEVGGSGGAGGRSGGGGSAGGGGSGCR